MQSFFSGFTVLLIIPERFNLVSISLTIHRSQYQCCLFNTYFTTILTRNKGWSVANDCQFFHPHWLEGSPSLLTFSILKIH